MPRWTSSRADVERLTRNKNDFPLHGIVQITLTDGRTYEGAVRGQTVGNNAGEGGWRYYGDVEIEGPEGRFRIDLLDVEHIQNVSASKKDAYEAQGFINIVDLPLTS